jgi:Secretion system C-terminal sorting domain
MKSITERIKKKYHWLTRYYWLVVPVFVVSIPCAMGQPEPTPTCGADVYVLNATVINAGTSVAYQAGSSIYTPTGAGKTYSIEGYARANFKAGKRIELNPGFEVQSKGSFTATIEVCKPSSINPSAIDVFPNPTTGVLTINSPNNIINSVRVTDMNALTKLEKWEVNVNALDLDLSDLKNGFYILEIIMGKNIQKVRIEKN